MNELVELIKRFEGLRLHAYQDSVGVWTIGYGSTGRDIVPGLVWTEEQADLRMRADASAALSAAQKLCPSLTGGALAAVADFEYNLGAGHLADSTLRKRINAGRLHDAAEEFGKWTHAGGVVLPGLVARRAAEKALFLASLPK